MPFKDWLRRWPSLQKALLPLAGKASFLRYTQLLKRSQTKEPDPLTPDMAPQPLEGYTNAHHYEPGQTVTFYLKAAQPNNQLQIQYLLEVDTWETIASHFFQEIHQPDSFENAQQGCRWNQSWTYSLLENAEQGYYRALLSSPQLNQTSEIHFLVGQAMPNAKVVVLAPVTTWLAYNAYGGQSLYRNAISADAVPFVSALRPNTALSYKAQHSMQHNLQVEANIFRWMESTYHADLLPDYYLEAKPDILEQYKVVVLAYHAEYFSEMMYQSLRELLWKQGKSLLALGANQAYWQVRWHQDFTQIECRKDASFFLSSNQRGKLMRHTPYPEANLLGVQFSEAGLNTFAPYKVTIPDHWLFAGTSVKEGQVFGMRGVDGKPICGDETDKISWCSPQSTVVVAKGLNKAIATEGIDLYYSEDNAWDGSGGGEIAMTELSDHHAVLATGSIHSGAGLGYDMVFTGLVSNFMKKYAGTASHGTTS